MLVKKGDLFQAQTIISSKIWLGDYNGLPDKEMALATAQTLYKLMDAINDIIDTRAKLLDKYSKKDKNGKMIVDAGSYRMSDKAGWDKAIEDYFNETVETDLINYDSLKGLPLNLAEINAISFLLE
jgi:hypothetical protein